MVASQGRDPYVLVRMSKYQLHHADGSTSIVEGDIDLGEYIARGYRVLGFSQCVLCGGSCHESFMVTDGTWNQAGLGPGVVHLDCLRERLAQRGHALTIQDFTPAPINNPIRFGFNLAEVTPLVG